MKKWSIMALVNRMNDFDFTIEAYDKDNILRTIVTSSQFKIKLMQKYYSFNFLTGSYFDPQYGEVELAENISEAITQFTYAYNVWREDRKNGLLKLLEALRAEYDPIWNVDGVEIETIIRDLDTTDTNRRTNTGTQTTNDTGTQTVSDTGTDTMQKTGTQTVANTGTSANAKTGTERTVADDQSITQSSPYDDNLFYNKERVDTDNDDTTTYNTTDTRTDNLSELTTNALTDTETKNLQSLRTDALQSQRTDNLTEQNNGSGTEDETTQRRLERHGNIGVTKTQELILSQFEVTEQDKLIDYIVNLFVHENCVI